VENITQFVGNIHPLQQRKNFENRLRFEKVIAKKFVASFFWNTVYINWHLRKNFSHWYSSFHFASAFVAVIFIQLMASSSALWRLNKPPSSFVSGHKQTMCSMVCCSPQSHSGDEARPHLCMLARHGPWPVRKRFNSVQEWRGRSKPGCWIVGLHTRWLLTTAADNQSSSHCALWSTGVSGVCPDRVSSYKSFLRVIKHIGIQRPVRMGLDVTEQFVCGWPTT